MPVKNLLILFCAIATDAAYGYIDPGPSNLIVQFLVAMGAGSLFFVKRIWHTVKALFTQPATTKKADETTPEKKRGKKAA